LSIKRLTWLTHITLSNYQFCSAAATRRKLGQDGIISFNSAKKLHHERDEILLSRKVLHNFVGFNLIARHRRVATKPPSLHCSNMQGFGQIGVSRSRLLLTISRKR